MGSYDLVLALEKYIEANGNSEDDMNFSMSIAIMVEDGHSELSIRRQLKKMGYYVDDYGNLRKVII